MTFHISAAFIIHFTVDSFRLKKVHSPGGSLLTHEQAVLLGNARDAEVLLASAHDPKLPFCPAWQKNSSKPFVIGVTQTHGVRTDGR